MGAERISEALSGTQQYPLLGLHFRSEWRRGEVLRVEYLKNVKPIDNHPVLWLYPRPTQRQWEIVVFATSRAARNRVKHYIDDAALPEIAKWLAIRKQQDCLGSEILAVFHDSAQDAFSMHQCGRLEPARVALRS